MLRLLISTLILAGLPQLAFGQEPAGWTGEAALNGSSSTGNTDTTDIGGSLAIDKIGENWRHGFKASADFSRSGGTTDERRYRLGYKIGRDVGERSYVFHNGTYFSDDFGAYKNGAFLGGGYGYNVFADEPTLWKLEAGLGYRSQKARLVPVLPTDPVSEKEEFVSARLSSDFERSFNERVRLSNVTELFVADVDTFLINETAITSDMIGNLALRASFRVETHTDVPAGREKTDTISRIGIVYTLD